MEKKFVTKSASETQDLAKKLLDSFGGQRFFALFGELGSGKTTFVQGLANVLGARERIISPTFIIVREHRVGSKKLYHVDLYRIEGKDIEGLGLRELINDSQNIVVVEWAEKIKGLLPEKRIELYFETVDENKRKITIRSYE